MRDNIHAIVQARMSSSRLPGKVLTPLKGKPVLWHIVSRLLLSRQLNGIIVATSTDATDDVIEQFCVANGYSFYRGALDNVLDRFHAAAAHYSAEDIVRVTADCPLVDPHILDEMIKVYRKETDVDYLSNTLKRTFPKGLDIEIFSFKALEQAHQGAHTKYEREHVTPFIYKSENLFKLFNYSEKVDRSHFRWTLDTPQDLELIRRIYDEFYDGKHSFFFPEILGFMQREPDLLKINAET